MKNTFQVGLNIFRQNFLLFMKKHVRQADK